MMRVFVAGASGAIGARPVPQLIDRGHEVIGTARSVSKAQRLRVLGAEQIVLDLLDPRAVRKAILDTKPDAIVHQATALTGLSDFKHFDQSFAPTDRLRTEGTDAAQRRLRLHTEQRQPDQGGGTGLTRGGPGFAGTWLYASADPQTLVNIVISRETGPDGTQVRLFPQTGIVGFTTGRDGIVVAHTGDGCRWTLVVRGNTAQLAPASQSCSLPGSTVTLTHWAIASDGMRQASVLAGVAESGARASNFLLNVGELIKQ